MRTYCVECGPDVSVDFDGTCANCGASAFGYHADMAAKAVDAFKSTLALLGKKDEVLTAGHGDAALDIIDEVGIHDIVKDVIEEYRIRAMLVGSPSLRHGTGEDHFMRLSDCLINSAISAKLLCGSASSGEIALVLVAICEMSKTMIRMLHSMRD